MDSTAFLKNYHSHDHCLLKNVVYVCAYSSAPHYKAVVEKILP